MVNHNQMVNTRHLNSLLYNDSFLTLTNGMRYYYIYVYTLLVVVPHRIVIFLFFVVVVILLLWIARTKGVEYFLLPIQRTYAPVKRISRRS